MSLDLIERADRPLNRAACALYDATGVAAWLAHGAATRLRRLEDDELVANAVRAGIRRVRRVRAYRRALAAIPWGPES